ncbi:MAG: DUF935 family protein [Spirochaetales bacterium]|nr:DUF935 family protein [Spirochaetales bacterium]
MPYLWGPDGKEKITFPDVNLTGGDHFATRARANEFIRLMRTLPDPDPILRKMGKGITALKDLLSDGHMESVWSVRCSSVSGAAWLIEPGGDGAKETEAAELFLKKISPLDVPRIIEEMMDAVAYGYSPLEVLWTSKDGYWIFDNIVGKPPEWFEFNQENQLVFKSGIISTEPVPANRFLLVRHRASYANPYGIKALSKCFWPVTFKKNGFRWWTVFVEKYGGAFLYGKYPRNADEVYKNELLDMLDRMITNAVGIAPEGADISIQESSTKGASSSVHKEYIAMANAEISKAILGQTLSTEIGEHGSYAAAQAHNLVRYDLAAADRRRVAAAFNRLSRIFTYFNFGEDVSPPVFTFEKEENLKTDRVERDGKLYAIGFRPRKEYISREYQIPEDEFDMADPQAANNSFTRQMNDYPHTIKHGKKKRGIIRFLKSLFSKKQERHESLMDEFKEKMIGKGQEDTDETIEKLTRSISKAKTFEDAFYLLASKYGSLPFKELVRLIDEIRYTSVSIGGEG